MNKLGVITVSALTFLNACLNTGIKGENYIDMKPEFKLEEYFNGPVKAWGIIQDRKGNVISRFDADLIGTWEGNQGVLEENFRYYDSGVVQDRRWEITKVDENNYIGSAGDIIGEAVGKSYGNAIQWQYSMDIPVENKTYRLKFDDWIWAMNDGVVINRSYLKKFGFTVAELTVFMQKL